MWQEVYYEHYFENCTDRYWEKEEKILPYSVKCKTVEEKKALETLLKNDGFKCVGGSDCIALLINLKLKRYCSYPKPASMSCIHSRSFSVENFLYGVYHPWYANHQYGIRLEEMKEFHRIRESSAIAYYRNQGLTDDEILEKLSCYY